MSRRCDRASAYAKHKPASAGTSEGDASSTSEGDQAAKDAQELNLDVNPTQGSMSHAFNISTNFQAPDRDLTELRLSVHRDLVTAVIGEQT